jgi:hypothetical protein
MLNLRKNFMQTALCLMAVVAISLLTATAAQAGEQDFVLNNKTGFVINKLQISPHSAESWEEDILGQGQLENGSSLKIRFARSEKAAHWDLRIEDENGKGIVWENLNLLEISSVTLHFKDGKAWADFE